jgi:hypothetical protein
MIHQTLVTSDSGVMIDISRLGHSNDWIEKKVRVGVFDGTSGQFKVGSVKRVSGLESNNSSPAIFLEVFSQLIWSSS